MAAVRLLPAGHGLLVDVERPVGERDRADRRLRMARRRRPRRRCRSSCPTRRRRRRGARSRRRRRPGGRHARAATWRREIGSPSASARRTVPALMTRHCCAPWLTTNVWSGSQIAATSRPGAELLEPGPAFWAKTWMSAPPSVADDVLRRDAEEAGVRDVAEQHVRPFRRGASRRPARRDLLGPHADAHGTLARGVDARGGDAQARAAVGLERRDAAPLAAGRAASRRFDDAEEVRRRTRSAARCRAPRGSRAA